MDRRATCQRLAGAAIAVRLQERARARRQHLAELKAKVFDPLRRDLEEFYRPLHEGTVGPVTLKDISVPVEGSITGPRRTLVWRLAPRRTSANPFLWLGKDREEPPQFSPELYADAKRCHYPKFLARLEAFKAEVEEWTKEAVRQAELLVELIGERTGLPHYEGSPPDRELSCIDRKALAAYVLNWRLGVTEASPFSPDHRSLQINGRTVAQVQTEGELKQVIDVLDDLAGDSRMADDLRQRAEPLAGRATRLRRELSQLTLSSRLPGGCKLARV